MQYWYENHATAAEEKVLAPINALSPGEEAASLQAYDARSLFCAVSMLFPLWIDDR